ncbi:MAG TPA: LysR family transcriptional regulator [Burkholderiales bacterium]|nr:LysR family transcriptional regulator [Burkholderiales bacterium]
MADRRLQVFHTVAKQLSFTRAAELLCMTQPAVTFQVKQLEEHFNTRLFQRSHGRIALTPAGRVVFDYAERILNLSGELETRMAELTGEVSGELLLGASLTIAEFMLPKVLGEFSLRHPQVQARMTVGNSEAIESKVANHLLDIGLIESPSHLSSLETQVCCEDELVVICAPGHALAGQSTVAPRQLVAQPYISRESGSGTRQFADRYFEKQGVSPDDLNVVMELGSLEAIKGVIERGLGVSIVSRATIAKELRLGTLVAVPLRPRLIRIMSLVYPRHKFRSRLIAGFVDFAMAKMQEVARGTLADGSERESVRSEG